MVVGSESGKQDGCEAVNELFFVAGACPRRR